MKTKQKLEEEIDFTEVIKTPMRWFGLVYPYFAVVMLLVGLYYIDSMDMIYLNKTAPALLDSVNTFKDASAVKTGRATAAADIGDITKPSAELLKAGETLFKSTCASCHGEQGMGNGVAGASLNPPPRNFHKTEGWKNGRGFSEMYKTLEEGIPGSGMPAYEYLPARDRIAVIHYIRSLTSNFPAITQDEAGRLNTKL
ncbi:MAG: c-type cytochrome [Bacteroidota bacterium]